MMQSQTSYRRTRRDGPRETFCFPAPFSRLPLYASCLSPVRTLQTCSLPAARRGSVKSPHALALGASRARVVRQLLAEGFVLSAVALILSLAVYGLTLRLMSAFEIPFNYSHTNIDLGLNYRT